MAVDSVFVNGVIAVKENSLLRGRLIKMCEGSPEEAFRTLTESGFARGAEVVSVYEYEKLLEEDGRDIDKFIRDYCPTKEIAEYLFSPRDYHNAKALIKAEQLKLSSEKLLSPAGLCSVEAISNYVKRGEGELPAHLAATIDSAKALFAEGNSPTGAEVGSLFDCATFSHLKTACRRDGLLKKFIARRADMTNILTAMRSSAAEYAKRSFVEGGKLQPETLLALFSGKEEGAERAMDGTPYQAFWRTCLKARQAGLPQTAGEKALAGVEESFLSENKYELKNKQPFLYYVFRRRAENDNVRIILSCLLAGMDGEDIKARLRSYD